MKYSLKILLIGILICSCGTISKTNRKNSFELENIGMMRTSNVLIYGKVMDKYEKFGLKGAEIKLSNNQNKFSMKCGDNGEFKFEYIPHGKYQLNANFVGYYQYQDSIEFKPGQIIGLKIGLGYEE